MGNIETLDEDESAEETKRRLRTEKGVMRMMYFIMIFLPLGLGMAHYCDAALKARD